VSHYGQGDTAIRDPHCLVLALQELGFEPVVHAEPQPLEGYEGRQRPERAHIIIPRRQVGSASNDIGFLLHFGPDGRTVTNVTAIVSDYDSRRHGPAWVNLVTAKTAMHKIEQDCKRRGKRTERIKLDGNRETVRVFA
jgi:Protein of unknown function (DUF1257)